MKTYTQLSVAAAKAKFRRMASGAGWQKCNNFQVGFCTWELRGSDIIAHTTYHSESTLDAMYKSNCKNW